MLPRSMGTPEPPAAWTTEEQMPFPLSVTHCHWASECHTCLYTGVSHDNPGISPPSPSFPPEDTDLQDGYQDVFPKT